MKRLTDLWRDLASEWGEICSTSTIRDIKTVTDRVDQEGESFLTITLPEFGKAFDRSLELNSIDYASFRAFSKRGGLPEFLKGFLSQVFDTDGVLLAHPDIDCIRAVRHLTMVVGKVERLAAEKRQRSAMTRYVQVEQELQEWTPSNVVEEIFPLFDRASTLLWADVFSHVENSMLDKHQLSSHWLDPTLRRDVNFQRALRWRATESGRRSLDPMDLIILGPAAAQLSEHVKLPQPHRVVEHGELVDCKVVDPAGALAFVPRHGPGATADRVRGNAKFSLRSWPQRLERVFPYGDYALPQLADDQQLDHVEFLEPGAEIPTEVIPVPKTDKTVRIIAEEPAAMQYMQQAFFLQFVQRLEEAAKFKPPTGGKRFDLGSLFIGFQDQEANRLLALKGSRDGSLATLDLSEASDRVLNGHVDLLLSRFPRLREGVQATRSSKARVPGHGVMPLAKFSSMGSALCFPMEAMVFVTIVICAIAYERRTPITHRFLYGLRGKVRVYGDDIIVPVDCAPRVIQFLEAFGLLVNKDKSYWNGKFRESCGGDYFDGEWVTPVRLRHELPQSLADVNGVVGLVAFRNLLYWNGLWKTAGKIDARLEALLKGRWKIADSTAAGLTRESVLPYRVEWIDQVDGLHEPRIAGAIVRTKIPKSPTTGEGALLKFLLKPGITPSQDENHLERQGRPKSARILLRGIRPY